MSDVTPSDLDDPTTDPFDVARAAAAYLARGHRRASATTSRWCSAPAGAAPRTCWARRSRSCPSHDVPGFSAAGRRRARRAPSGRSGSRAPTSTRSCSARRTHLYEGRGVRRVVHGVRTAAAAGATTVVLTNGCGGLNPAWGPGTPGADQRPHQPHGDLPARGCDVRRPHRPVLVAAAGGRARGRPDARRGRLRAVPRPALRDAGRGPDGRASLGGDLVGMSTTLEAIAARHAGLEVLGISLVTNLAAGISRRPARPTPRCSRPGRAAGPRISALLAADRPPALTRRSAAARVVLSTLGP